MQDTLLQVLKMEKVQIGLNLINRQFKEKSIVEAENLQKEIVITVLLEMSLGIGLLGQL